MYVNHFSFKELTRTAQSLDNSVDSAAHLVNLGQLWDYLNLLREKLGQPIYINSAFRTPEVNKRVGGSPNSFHMQGRAADIRTIPLYMDDLWSILESEKDELQELIKYSTFYHIAI